MNKEGVETIRAVPDTPALVGIRSTTPWVNDRLYGASPSVARAMQIDAAFVPTLGARRNLYRLIEQLAGRCSQVFVIPTDASLIDRAALGTHGAAMLPVPDQFHGMPAWQQDPSLNHSASHSLDFDLPAKRNLALSFARDRGFRRIILVDDDIVLETLPFMIPDGEPELFAVAGYYSLSFPDISAVDYLEVSTSGRIPEVALGGSCICIDHNFFEAYFPYIYNEDWLFLLQVALMGGKVVGVGSVTQLPHAPWSRKQRIAFEQFGDVLASGLRIIGATNSRVLSYDPSGWTGVYDAYARKVARLVDRASEAPHLRDAAKIAQAALVQFNAEDVANFFERWVKPITGSG